VRPDGRWRIAYTQLTRVPDNRTTEDAFLVREPGREDFDHWLRPPRF
jgi:hypothetical protein